MFEKYLSGKDDPALWTEVLKCLSEDIALIMETSKWKGRIYLRIGACSHWLRPHQTRWSAVGGGFAWPTGYGGSGYSRMGLPEFDWSVVLLWCLVEQNWKIVNKMEGKRNYTIRVAIPTRTTAHNQAAIHLFWERGTPENPNKKLYRFYGFKKIENKWLLVDSLGNDY